MGTTSGASYIDNDVTPETTYQYYLIAINAAGSSSPSATITITTPPSLWIDLDIDSFNTSRFEGPSRTLAEEDIEDASDHFGKIIYPNYGDADGDGILDIWDGYNGGGQFESGTNCSERFVPIVIEIPAGIDLASAKFQFDFWSGSLPMSGFTPGSPPRFGDGNIRIWTKDGNEPRSGNDIKQYGNLVSDGVSYTAEQLGFTAANRTITLYVEGHMPSSTLGNREIIVRMDCVSNGQTVTVEDRVRYTVAGLGLQPYTPQTAPFQLWPLADQNWKENGVGIRRNTDFDNGGTTPDSSISGNIANENDLIRTDLIITPMPGIKYVIRKTDQDLKLWTSSTKGTEYVFTNNERTFTEGGAMWAEYASAGNDRLSFTLVAIDTNTNRDLFTDTITFQPFNSAVIVLGGEFSAPSDPVAYPGAQGIFDWAIDRYREGYNVYMYNEDDCNGYGQGATYDDLVNSINNHRIQNVVIFGYSHGGGSAYGLSWRLNENVAGRITDISRSFNIVLTGYIDGIYEYGGSAETRRPLLTSRHVNYYQQNTDFEVVWLNGAPSGADAEHHIDPTGAAGITHLTIDDDPFVLHDFEDELKSIITPGHW